jgi:NADPH:quinone reductase-like Zn-dependent oxidoreductase
LHRKAAIVPEGLFSLGFSDVALPELTPLPWTLIGAPAWRLPEPSARCASMLQLPAAEIERGSCLVLTCSGGGEAAPQRALEHSAHLLHELQAWLADETLHARPLVVLTRTAIATGDHEQTLDLGQAPLWGAVRSLQSERPDLKLVLLDVDDSLDDAPELFERALIAAVTSGESQLAVRAGALRAPRLERQRETLQAPAGAEWSLQIASAGTFEGLALRERPLPPLAANDVRLAVHAAGVNFRDVLGTLGMYPGDPGQLGLEGAGVVLEVGAEVRAFKPGDRVFGALAGAFSPQVVMDARYLAPLPADLSYAQAATIPSVFLTAFYGLIDLAELQRGERVLVHAAAGGVGMAAVQLAQHMGAEVFATASPGKWPALRALGLPDSHIASSRTLEFEAKFRALLGDGGGIDVALNSLTQELLDASLRLMKPAGRFIDMGKTDIRAPGEVAAKYQGVRYRAFDMTEVGPDRSHAILHTICDGLARGALRPLPLTAWDVRRAPEAFRHMAQARHIGKNVLIIPQPLAADGTVLITGGTGTLGGLLATHLVKKHGVRRVLLCSRSGAGEELRAQLERAGAHVTIAVCDVSQREQVRALLAEIPDEHPLTAVFHTAGVLDDGLFSAQTEERFGRVFAPKVDGAFHLHELTRGAPLDAFVLFSSAAGLLGGAGQSNYAAANAFLDALAHVRHAEGLPATALSWGLWQQPSGTTAHLTKSDLERMARSGVLALPTAEALTMLDYALGSSRPQLVPNRFDPRLFQLPAEQLPRLLERLGSRQLRRAGAASAHSADAFKARLAALAPEERQRLLLSSVAEAVRTVLTLGATPLEPDRPLSELGLDSLTAVELRNHLAALSGLRLATTLLFDYPTPIKLARHLHERLAAELPSAHSSIMAELNRLEAMLAELAPNADVPNELPERLRALSRRFERGSQLMAADAGERLEGLDDEALYRVIDDTLGE